MKVVLASLNSRYVHSNLAIRYLKSYALGFNIEIYERTINESSYEIALDIAYKKPDIVGFSCYIWNIENTLKVCSILKQVNQDIKIVLGGPEVSYDPKEVLEKYQFIDFVVYGEGEKTFKELLEALVYKREIVKVKGLAYRNEDGVFVNEKRPLILNLDEIPFPYDKLPEKIIYYEASRGCPFNCKYCLSSTIKGVRFFSLDRVKRDLKFFIDNNVKLVKFVDRTFNANKKVAIEIWNFLIENAKSTKFHFEIAADLLDDECLDVLKRAPYGLFQFEIGVQTTNLEVLKNINRVMNFKRVKENVRKILDEGNIHCHLDLIVGLPGEDLDSFKKSFEDVMSIRPDVLQIGFLKVLKGSDMSKEKDIYGIKHSPYPPYQVVKTKDLSFEDILFLTKFEETFEIYYNSHLYDITINYFLNKIKSYEFFYRLTNYLDKRGFFELNHDLNSKTKMLYEFLKAYDEEDLVKDLLIHDYVFTTKKSYLPEFLKKDMDFNLKDFLKEKEDEIKERLNVENFKNLFVIPTKISYNKEYVIGNFILVIDLSRKIWTYFNK
ncbi:Radical SAM superfamily enzyme YgiQ, UPF0313 family [Caloramator fervidus]|uniref:Radical SAM superfamily enzyme YgiQ, UPF0313 family n=1 Tax=Caloramator fervidus TaxID=29344 RepID=A0A1H5UDA6_9CLOT|nr:B12-binding domain-containing radical SAM protein [Caloramator fervidus]SEF72418.1 Radical SAM superfamily enzyme YgiQ, UPF0313 family [Caloramator fervidus]